MNIDLPLQLLAGMTPRAFMDRYWQREPLLIRQAIPGFRPPLSLTDIRKLIAREEVESRMVWKDEEGWHMKRGPFSRLPSQRRPGWTALAQAVDQHDDASAELMHRFRFIPDARLDDAMYSIASDEGGVGPHFDSYDVFLLQAHGRRHWRIGRQRNLDLVPGLPLKILQHFEPEAEYVLEPGDMLYLPPHVAHDGIAQGDCMTISIGFRTPTLAALARGMLEAAGDQLMARIGADTGLYGARPLPGPRLDGRYQDKGSRATAHPAQVPDAMVQAALDAVRQVRFDERLAARLLGLWLTEPSTAAWFEPDAAAPETWPGQGRYVLDRCTRLMYRGAEVYINGELAGLKANAAVRQLADERHLDCASRPARTLSAAARAELLHWASQGWMHYLPA